MLPRAVNAWARHMMDESSADTGEPQSTLHEIRLELFERERELFERSPPPAKPQSVVHEAVDDTWLDAVLAGVLARNDLLGSTPGARDNFAAAGGWDKDSFAAPAAAPLFHAPLPTPPRVSSLKEYEVRALAAAASSTISAHLAHELRASCAICRYLEETVRT